MVDIYSKYARTWEGVVGFGLGAYEDARKAGYSNREIQASVSGKNVGANAAARIEAGVREEKLLEQLEKVSKQSTAQQKQFQEQQKQFEQYRATAQSQQESLQQQLKQSAVKQVEQPKVSGVNTSGRQGLRISGGSKKFAREGLKIGSINI